jgi:hypothetical protein
MNITAGRMKIYVYNFESDRKCMKKAATRAAFAKDKARNVIVSTCLESDAVARIISTPVMMAKTIKTYT